MPRRPIELECRVEHLSILDEHGQVDPDLEPAIPAETLLAMHRAMLLSRRFDARLLMLQRQGRLGTFAPGTGQEAAQIGAVATLEPRDWVLPTYREGPALIWRGTPLWGLLLYDAGFNEGGAPPQGWNNLPISIPVGSQIPHAVGLAYAARQRGLDEVALAFFGDGATSTGDFHEALNFAAVFETATIFLCQNNQWAISVPRERQTRARTLAQKALAYGVPGLQVDGNDILAVYAATAEAVNRARAGEGPTLVEALTYRMGVHTTADDPTRYRKEEELREWEKKDPISRFQSYLHAKGLLDQAAVAALEEEVKAEIEAAWEEAQRRIAAAGDPLHLFEHLYAEAPPYLAEQREAFARHLREQRG